MEMPKLVENFEGQGLNVDRARYTMAKEFSGNRYLRIQDTCLTAYTSNYLDSFSGTYLIEAWVGDEKQTYSVDDLTELPKKLTESLQEMFDEYNRKVAEKSKQLMMKWKV